MRAVPDIMTARWYSGEYFGDARPIARVTVHKPNISLHETADNLFASLMFGGGGAPRELPNVKSVSWARDVDQDVATCEIVFYNAAPLPIGETPLTATPGELDQPGYYTYNRGTTQYSSRWGHKANEWANMLMPDNILRTFEGYGCDPTKTPEYDPNLVQTGVWMIDEVSISVDGLINVACRDVGRLLLDHIAFPPVTPFKAGFVTKDLPDGAYSYPVSFAGFNTDPIINKVPTPANASRLSMAYRTSSNHPYTGHGSVFGHFPREAFDDNDATYWLSIGNARPDQGYSFEWIEGSIKKQRVRRVRFKSLYSGHTAYLCLYVEGKGWVGSRKVPYDPNHPASAPNGADTNYHRAQAVSTTGWTEFNLDDGVADVSRVRITFGGLRNSKLGTFPYRAGVRRIEVYGGATTKTTTEVTTFEDKNYDDYTDIVKLLCAWGGFYWPRNVAFQVGGTPGDEYWVQNETRIRERLAQIRINRGLPPDATRDTYWTNLILAASTLSAKMDLMGQARNEYDFLASNQGAEEILTGGDKRWWPFTRDDPAMTIRVGRVWGDFQLSGTAGPAPLGADLFDKKPLMDGIAYVRDILGFIFHVDEYGGVVFKAPNIYSVGNTLRSLSARSGERTTNMITIDERQTLINVSTNLASRNVRERTFISNATGTVGHMAAGWNPNPIGMRRVGGWTDQNFESAKEARIMAESIALRQLMTYRTDQVTIPGYPRVQIDDQVRVFERITSEGYIHYVSGIASSLDHESGDYTYTLETHWLGERPFQKWAFDPKQLSRETQDFIAGLYPPASYSFGDLK